MTVAAIAGAEPRENTKAKAAANVRKPNLIVQSFCSSFKVFKEIFWSQNEYSLPAVLVSVAIPYAPASTKNNRAHLRRVAP
jgi:hypothetical protein